MQRTCSLEKCIYIHHVDGTPQDESCGDDICTCYSAAVHPAVLFVAILFISYESLRIVRHFPHTWSPYGVTNGIWIFRAWLQQAILCLIRHCKCGFGNLLQNEVDECTKMWGDTRRSSSHGVDAGFHSSKGTRRQPFIQLCRWPQSFL